MMFIIIIAINISVCCRKLALLAHPGPELQGLLLQSRLLLQGLAEVEKEDGREHEEHCQETHRERDLNDEVA